jgi:hypothetical protein
MSLQKISVDIKFPIPVENVNLDQVRTLLLEEETDPIEIELLLKILYSIPMAEFKRYQELISKQTETGKLTRLEQSEIRSLLGQLDRYALDRNNALIDLANHRRIPVQQLMEELKEQEEAKAVRAKRLAATPRWREQFTLEEAQI